MDWLVGLALSVFVLYWIIRTAVHHGIRDADRERLRISDREAAGNAS